MHCPPTLLNTHKRNRLTALLRLALLWCAAALLGALAPNRRHIKQRYGWLCLDGLVRNVCILVMIRATEMAHPTLKPNPTITRRSAPPGFRRAQPRSPRRAMIGAHLRRFFRGDAYARIKRLLAALSDLDDFVRRHALKRAKRRLTKLRPLLAVRPPTQVFVSAPASAPQFADSS